MAAVKAYFAALDPYIRGLMVQAKYRYRTSSWFKERWILFGVDKAEEMFEDEVMYWFRRAKKEPLQIRAMIFWDTMVMGREPTPYEIEEVELA